MNDETMKARTARIEPVVTEGAITAAVRAHYQGVATTEMIPHQREAMRTVLNAAIEHLSLRTVEVDDG